MLCLALALFIALPYVAFAARNDEPFTLTTDDTRIVLQASDTGIQIKRLEDIHTGYNWAVTETRVSLVTQAWVAGREITLSWKLLGSKLDRGKGVLTFTFAASDPDLLLRSIWRARKGRGPVEHHIEIENRSPERVTVSHQDSLTLTNLRPGAPAALWWIRRGAGNASTQGGAFMEPLSAGTNLLLKSDCENGASPVPWLAVQIGEERGLYVGWEFSGLGRVEAQADADGAGLTIRVGLLPDFKTDIAAGEILPIPPALVGCYAGDRDEGSYSLHRFIVEHLRPRPPKGYPDPSLNYAIYLDAGGPTGCKEADLLRVAQLAHALQFEAFMPDAMWFPACGDWRWDPARFPAGITPIEQSVHRQGLKMALWCAWTSGGVASHPDALSVRGPVGHPDWFGADFAPDWQPGPFYGAQLCLGSPEAKEWALRKTQALVGEQHLDYLKHDCGPIVNRCNKTTHRHRYGVDASYWATMGYYEVQEQLRAAYPSLVLENCSGGGHLKDFGVIARTHYTVTTDTLSNLPDRQSLWDSTFAFPPLLLQAYTYDQLYNARGDEPGPFFWRSAMMSAWQLAPANSAGWTEEECDSVQRAAQIYKEWIRPMFRDVKVHHILPRPDGVHWDGLFYWSPGLKRGTLYIFRPDAPENERTIRLKGLSPGNRYWVWGEDNSVEHGVRTGAELMERGLSVRLPNRYTSDLIYVRDAALGKPAGLEAPGAFALARAVCQTDPFTVSARLAWRRASNAKGYRLVVSEHADLSEPLTDRMVSSTRASLAKLPEGRTLYWNVEAVAWGGRRWSASAPARFVTPKRKPLPGVSFVSDVEWEQATIGVTTTSVLRDTNLYGRPISIGGKSYPKGLWTHAFSDATPADIVVDIAYQDYAVYTADVGLDDASGGGSVQFQVLADGIVKAESQVLRPGAVHRFRVDVTGARKVTLRVLNGGDGHACDHAAWGMARFIKAGAIDPFAAEP